MSSFALTRKMATAGSARPGARPPIEPLLLRDDEAAVLLGVSRRTVATLARAGQLTPIRPAGMRMRRFARAELVSLAERWIQDAKREDPTL
jgi:excisionase family DNA binding protein